MAELWYIDPDSYRVDRTHFPTEDEAISKASECAHILGRSIRVWFHDDEAPADVVKWRVMPDGSKEKEKASDEHEDRPADSPIMIGMVLDEVAAALDERGADDLAEQLDAIMASLTMAADKDKKPAAPQPAVQPDDHQAARQRNTFPSGLAPLMASLERVLQQNPQVSDIWVQRGLAVARQAYNALRAATERYDRMSHSDANRLCVLFWLIEILIRKVAATSGE